MRPVAGGALAGIPLHAGPAAGPGDMIECSFGLLPDMPMNRISRVRIADQVNHG